MLVNNLRVEARAGSGWRGALVQQAPAAAPEPWKRRAVVLDAGAVELPVWRRRDLPPGFAVAGPAVVEEQSSSLVIGAGETARVDAASNLVVEL